MKVTFSPHITALIFPVCQLPDTSDSIPQSATILNFYIFEFMLLFLLVVYKLQGNFFLPARTVQTITFNSS